MSLHFKADSSKLDGLYQRKRICVVIVDALSPNDSTRNSKIMQALDQFEDCLHRDSFFNESIDVCVLSAGESINIERSFIPGSEFCVPTISISENCCLNSAINLASAKIESRKKLYRECGVSYSPAVIILITSGLATDEHFLIEAKEIVEEFKFHNKSLVFSLCIDDANLTRLQSYYPQDGHTSMVFDNMEACYYTGVRAFWEVEADLSVSLAESNHIAPLTPPSVIFLDGTNDYEVEREPYAIATSSKSERVKDITSLRNLFSEDAFIEMNRIFTEANSNDLSFEEIENLNQKLRETLIRNRSCCQHLLQISPSGKNYLVASVDNFMIINLNGVALLFEVPCYFEGDVSIQNVQWIEEDHLVTFIASNIPHGTSSTYICYYADSDAAFVYTTPELRIFEEGTADKNEVPPAPSCITISI